MRLRALVGRTEGARCLMSPYYALKTHTNPRAPAQPLRKALWPDSPPPLDPKIKYLQEDASWPGVAAPHLARRGALPAWRPPRSAQGLFYIK